MSIKFNVLCSLIKKLQIYTQNDIKRLEKIVPSIVSEIAEHPSHASLLLYHLSRTTKYYNSNYNCKACKGFCEITFRPLAQPTLAILDTLSPKALAQILKIYSNCRNDSVITDQTQLRLCYFMLSCLNFPAKYLNIYKLWTSEYRLSAGDYLNLRNLGFNQSQFYLPLVIHDVADLIQSLYYLFSRPKSNIKELAKQVDYKAKLILEVSLGYIDKLLHSDITEKDIHSITRIFYYYNELIFFNDNVKQLWIVCMDKCLEHMNIFDICTMLHAFHSPLDKYKHTIALLECRLSELLPSEDNLNSLSTSLNALFKCSICNSSIAQLVHNKSMELLKYNTKSIELVQIIKMLMRFDLDLTDMISLLHRQTINCKNLLQIFSIYDLAIILKWYKLNELDCNHILNTIIEADNFEEFAKNTKFDSIYYFTTIIDELSLFNDHIICFLSKLLNLAHKNFVGTVRLDKLLILYKIFPKELLFNHWIVQSILDIIQNGNIIESFKISLESCPEFASVLKERIQADLTVLNPNLLIKLCSTGSMENLSLLPLEAILKKCDIVQLSCLLKYIPQLILPKFDMQAIVDNTRCYPNPNLSISIYKCILRGVRGDDAEFLIDYFIDCQFNNFKELMMACIIANMPNIAQDYSLKIAKYVLKWCNGMGTYEKLKILNKLMPISLKFSYDLVNVIFATGVEILTGVEMSGELAKFVSYLIRLDKYRNDFLLNLVPQLMYNNYRWNSTYVAQIGLIGMQYWGTKCTIKWLKVAKTVDNHSDFYTSIQFRMFVNPNRITLDEVKLMEDFAKTSIELVFVKPIFEKPIIREVEESIGHSTTTPAVWPKVDILILNQ